MLYNTIRRQTKKKAAKIGQIENPFSKSRMKEQRLWDLIERRQLDQRTPRGYGFLPGEGNYYAYDCMETLEIGTGYKKESPIILPETVWHPRTVLWVQALEVMNLLILEN